MGKKPRFHVYDFHPFTAKKTKGWEDILNFDCNSVVTVKDFVEIKIINAE